MEPAPSDANNDSVKLTTKTQNENAIILDAQLTTALITVHIPTSHPTEPFDPASFPGPFKTRKFVSVWRWQMF